MHFGKSQTVSSRACRVASLLIIGFVIGVLLNEYGFVFENIRVNVKITVISDDLRASQLPHELQQADKTSYVVPNIVHFIWFTDDDAGKRVMTFVDYMSIRSVYRIQQPDEIQFHCSRLPELDDVWWAQLWKEIPLRIVYHDKSALLGQLRTVNTHCKLTAMKVLLEHGGIFIDWNVLVVKNLDPLRLHSVTLGKESESRLSTDVVAARQNDTFLRRLVESHRTDLETCDIDDSAYQLSIEHPDLLNTVSFHGPAASHLSGQLISNLDMPYVVRLSQNNQHPWLESTPESIKSINGTVGAAMRYIYYGSE